MPKTPPRTDLGPRYTDHRPRTTDHGTPFFVPRTYRERASPVTVSIVAPTVVPMGAQDSVRQHLRALLYEHHPCTESQQWITYTTFTSVQQAWSTCPVGQWAAYLVQSVMFDERMDNEPSDKVTNDLRELTTRMYLLDVGTEVHEESYLRTYITERTTSVLGNQRSVYEMTSYFTGMGNLTKKQSLELARALRKVVKPYIKVDEDGKEHIHMRWLEK